MSVADKLGTGKSFANTGGRISARRQAIADATGAPTVGAADSRLKTLPLEQLVPTRFNPRRNFGTDDDLRDFGTKLKTKQLAPAVAVTREAYLALWEGEAEAVGTHRYVIANGERRFRASQHVGLETLEVIVDDTIAETRATFLDAVLSENNDREDLDPVEQAIGIQTMVDQLGGKAKVAEHYGKSGGWVTQQLYLLRLAPELQQLVSAGTLPVRETRELIKLPVEEQASEWERRLKARNEPKPAPEPTPKEPETFTAVKNDAEPAADTSGGTGGESAAEAESAPAFTAVKNEAAQPTTGKTADPAAAAEAATSGSGTSPTSKAPPTDAAPSAQPATGDGVPGQREEQSEGGSKPAPVWDEPGAISGMIRMRMKDNHFFTMLGHLLKQGAERDEQELRKVLSGYIAST